MRLRRLFPAVALALVCFAPAQVAAKGPNALVASLYQAHNHKRGPFFQTRSKALLYQYFEKDLADMIWKDRINAKGEVGVIDGDPLYDAQDMEIKNFSISKAKQDGTNASVDVNFENLGQKKTITFLLVNGKTGWRIHDIAYGEGRTLRSQFKEAGQSSAPLARRSLD
jgi:Protein of unknown function (DUF3828)